MQPARTCQPIELLLTLCEDIKATIRHKRSQLWLPSLLRSVPCHNYPLLLSYTLTPTAPAFSLACQLYVIAAVATASGVPYALTFLRCTNGALSRRAEKLAGPGNGAIALTYAFNDKRSIDREKSWSTKDMVMRWKWHNEVRTVILTLGTIAGAWAVGLRT